MLSSLENLVLKTIESYFYQLSLKESVRYPDMDNNSLGLN